LPSNRWLLGDEAAGLVVPPDDPHAMADAIVALLEDPPLTQRLGAAGQQRVENEFSIAAMADALIGLFDELRAPLQPEA
jgi:glycosyltransferase involved in cell wall biosynthesis